MPDYRQNHPTDVFFCNLLEIDPYHLQHLPEYQQSSNETSRMPDELVPRKFIDPRTGIEIPSHECNHRDVNLEKRNIFLSNYIQASSLSKSQHVAGLNALLGIEADKPIESSAANRLEEKQLFLDKLKEHYFAKLSRRFHDVPPPIDYFIVQKWKKQLIEMHRRLATARYCMRTAIALQPSQCTVNANYLHQERLSSIPKMSDTKIEYLKQSFSQLMNAYNQQKTKQTLPAVRTKVNDLIDEHGIDFVIPISTLKLILNSSNENDWLFCMTVRDSAKSTPFDVRKEIILVKALPPTRLRGNERYRKGAKYLLYSCLNQNSTHHFNCDDQSETKTDISAAEPMPEIELGACGSNTENIEYKISSNDDFIKQYPKNEYSHENRMFTVVEVIGCDGAENDDEAFKVLVTAKQAAYKRVDDAIQFVNYSPKIEFQAEYGAEVMTQDELLQEWCDLFFRPKTISERRM